MTKDEMITLVELVHSHYGERMPTTEALKKQVYLAWWHCLSDIEYLTAKKAINELAVTETFKPRPALVRKRAIAETTPQAPTTAEAWALIQNLIKDLNTGSIERKEIHECIQTAIRQLGGLPAIQAETNGDRNFFAGVYEPIVSRWEMNAYAIPDID